MSNQMTIAMDVDEPIADLISTWIEKYNNDYKDNLQKSQIKEWDLSKFVKPECGHKIYDYLKDPHLYDDVFPNPLAPMGIRELREMGYRIVYVTASPIEQAGVKFNWLKNHGFIDNRKDYVEMDDKSLIRADIMFDDGFHNVVGFKGVGVLLNEPWNIEENWNIRADDWYAFLEIAKVIKDK